MKTSLASALVLCVAGISSAGLAPLSLPKTGKIAVLGFSLNKSIVMEEAERDQGPGVLQKPEDYYRTHQALTDSLWSVFRDTAATIFAGLDVLPLDSFKNDASYNEASRCVPKKVMGREIFSCLELEPKAGPNAIFDAKNSKVNGWATKKGVARYFTISNKAEYFLYTGAGVGNTMAGVGKMRLATTILLLEPGKGIIWSGTYTNSSNAVAPMIKDIFPESSWITATEAFRQNLADFAKDAAAAKAP